MPTTWDTTAGQQRRSQSPSYCLNPNNRSCGHLGPHSVLVEPQFPAVTGAIAHKVRHLHLSFGTPENRHSFACSRLYFSGDLLLAWEGVTNRLSLRAASRRMALLVPKQLRYKCERSPAAHLLTKGSYPKIKAHQPGHGPHHHSTGPSKTAKQTREP